MRPAIFESALLIGGAVTGWAGRSLVSRGPRWRGLCAVASLALVGVLALDYEHGGLGLIRVSSAGLYGLLVDLFATAVVAIATVPLLLAPFGLGVELGIALRTSGPAGPGDPALEIAPARIGPPPTRQPDDRATTGRGLPADQREELLALLRDRPPGLSERAPVPRG
jgi:hypothetical protein